MGRRLGQHFLSNKETAKKIVDTANLKQDDIVVEIGPGRGVLTELMLPKVKELIAVEVDYKLANYLKGRLSRYGNLNVINDDFLRIKPFPKKGVKFVANLPYYITSPIMQKIIDWPGYQSAYVMIQKEVAQRLVAEPGSSDYGILTISVGLKAQTKMLFNVAQTDFSPPPKVLSSVIKISPHSKYDLSGINEKRFYKLLHACFQQKRKTLANSLSHNLGIPKKEIYAILEKIGFNPNSRAEDIPIQSYLDLNRDSDHLFFDKE